MKRLIPLLITGICSLTLGSTISLAVLFPSVSNAQPAPVLNDNQARFTQAQLDQLLAPIALYPDPLLTHVLIAAGYPQEVEQALQSAKAHPSLTGKSLALAVDPQPWDSSVKFLTQFPDVLTMMIDQPVWTQRLGDAFLAQQADVMNTVQSLRRRALEQGTLIGCKQRVRTQKNAILIEPVVTNEIYVPYYNPTIVYGTWWRPDYVPFVWLPPVQYRPVFVSTGFVFGVGIILADSLFFPVYPDWHRHHFMRGDWHDHHDWQARTAWRPDFSRRAGAASFRGATTQNQYQTRANSPLNLNRNIQQRDLVNNRTPAMRQGVQPGYSGAATQRVRPSNNRTQQSNRAPRAQQRAQPNAGFSPAARQNVRPSDNRIQQNNQAPRVQRRAQPDAGFSPAARQRVRPSDNRVQQSNQAPRVQQRAQPDAGFSRGNEQVRSSRPGGSESVNQPRSEQRGYGGGRSHSGGGGQDHRR